MDVGQVFRAERFMWEWKWEAALEWQWERMEELQLIAIGHPFWPKQTERQQERKKVTTNRTNKLNKS